MMRKIFLDVFRWLLKVGCLSECLLSHKFEINGSFIKKLNTIQNFQSKKSSRKNWKNREQIYSKKHVDAKYWYSNLFTTSTTYFHMFNSLAQYVTAEPFGHFFENFDKAFI